MSTREPKASPMLDKPTTLAAYQDWLSKRHGVKLTDQTAAHYEDAVRWMLRAFRETPFWQALQQEMQDLDNQHYARTHDFLLLPSAGGPHRYQLEPKPYGSFLLKTFRKNVLENANYPDPPAGGWVLPDTWFTRIHDLVRTLIVVRYMDGVPYVRDFLQRLCASHQVACDATFEARTDGYYACHVDVTYSAAIPPLSSTADSDAQWRRDGDTMRPGLARPQWDMPVIAAHAELQITTQIQEIVRTLLHRRYEAKRQREWIDPVTWQWDHTSKEFAANYLGHVLHYLEGRIIEVREHGGDQ